MHIFLSLQLSDYAKSILIKNNAEYIIVGKEAFMKTLQGNQTKLVNKKYDLKRLKL